MQKYVESARWVADTREMKLRCLAPLLAVGCLCVAEIRAADHAPAPVSVTEPVYRLLHEATLTLLRDGNARFIAGKTQHPHLEGARRTNTVANGQEPFATILSCSDSRAPAELIFDRGVGDLFIVRVAGNIAGGSELATVEYGAEHLGTPVVIVMGHTKCGAVTAVVKGAELHGHLLLLADEIKPAADQAKAAGHTGDALVPAAIEANVWRTMENLLTRSSIVNSRVKSGRTLLIGAVYDLESGKVRWLGPHPQLVEVLARPPKPTAGTAKPQAKH